jgi:hypothetical protein
MADGCEAEIDKLIGHLTRKSKIVNIHFQRQNVDS